MVTGENFSYIIGLLVTILLLSIVVIPLLVELFSVAFQQEADVSPVIVARVVMTVILVLP